MTARQQRRALARTGRHGALVALALTGILLSGVARGHEVILGLEARAEYDDNVFRTKHNAEDDVILRGGPTLRARSERGDLQYDVRYRPSYEGFLSIDGISGVDHFARAQADWHVTDTTQISLVDDFNRTRSLSRRLDVQRPGDVAPVDLVPDIERGRERVLRNVSRLAAVQQMTPRWSGLVSFDTEVLEFSDERLFDSLTLDGEASVEYALTPRDRVGLGGGVIRTDLNGETTSSGGATNYYRGFASWAHRVDPTLDFRLEAGPTWVDPQGSGGHDLTVFGSANLTKVWKTLSATLRYDRTASTVSGINTTTDLDAVLGRLVWRPSPKWRAALVASWTRRKSSTDQDFCVLFVAPFGCLAVANLKGAIDLQLARVQARVERRLRRRFVVFALSSYARQTSSGRLAGSGGDEFDNVRVILGLRYELDGLHL